MTHMLKQLDYLSWNCLAIDISPATVKIIDFSKMKQKINETDLRQTHTNQAH